MNILPYSYEHLLTKTSGADEFYIISSTPEVFPFYYYSFFSTDLAAPIPSSSQKTGETIGRLRFTNA